MNGLIVDLFAGGGGASLGVEMGLERAVDIAINHDPEAIAMHRANHPWTRHYTCDIHEVDPVEACQGRPVDFMWASPDCTHHSKAKGGKPRDKKLRFLAWTVVEWARKVRPAVICLENVEEFQDWGPLDDEGQPIKAMKGIIFQSFVKALRGLGYGVDWRQLKACDYGAPTTRKRLFLVARADGSAPEWPDPTHGMGRIPYRTASECIDWTIPCPSIFDRKKPLAEATCKRIAKGIVKFVLENPRPFIVQIAHYNGNNIVQDSLDPLRTITSATKGGEFALVSAFLLKYYGTNVGFNLTDPAQTVTSKDRFGLVTVTLDGEPYVVVDIGLRMLKPRELFRAQGFPDNYVIDAEYNGKRLSQTAQVRMVGNSVCPPVAAALARANVREAVGCGIR